MRWARYRYKSSSGPGDWEWAVIDDDQTADDIRDNVAPDWRDSEHYRGTEVELDAVPPVEVVTSKRDEALRMARSWSVNAENLNDYLYARTSDARAQAECLCKRARGGIYPCGACPIHGKSHGGGMSGHDE